MKRYSVIFVSLLLWSCTGGIAPLPPDDAHSEDMAGDHHPPDVQHEEPADTTPEAAEAEGDPAHDEDAIEEEEETPQCPEGTTRCGEDCVDTSTDRNHCGGCFNPCGEEESCRGGRCVCPPGLTSCGGRCVDTGAEHDYCGDCGRSCSEEAVCSGGSCRVECDGELAECETGSCYDLNSSTDHCGDCETACERSSQICVEGSCRPYTFPEPSCWHCPCETCSEAELRCCVIGVPGLRVCIDAEECP